MIGSILHRFGVHILRGSSTWVGSKDAHGHNLAEEMEGKWDYARWATGTAARGAGGNAYISALSGAPVLPCRHKFHAERITKLGSDGLSLTVWTRRLVCEPPSSLPRNNWEGSLPIIVDAMTAAADCADSSCNCLVVMFLRHSPIRS